MLSGSISLKHPSLNLRPEFTAAVHKPEDAEVVLFDTQDQADLGATLEQVTILNSEAAKEIKLGNAEYTRAEAAGEHGFKQLEQRRRGITSKWVDLNKLSEASLKTASSLASRASYSLGPVIMGACENLAGGVQKIALYPQTSREGLIGQGSGLADLTGDSYRNTKVDTSMSGGVVQIEDPLFNPASTPSGNLIVDSRSGVAVLEDLRPKKPSIFD